MVVALLAGGATSALAGSAASALAAIVAADGPGAVSSPIVAHAGGSLALVAHTVVAPERTAAGQPEYEAVFDVYRYRAGAWARLARISGPFLAGPGLTGQQTTSVRPVSLTGATDFLVGVGAGFPIVSLVSDAGGRWQLVPFDERRLPRGFNATGTEGPGGTSLSIVSVGRVGYTPSGDGGEITTVLTDELCVSNCSSDTRRFTWRYDAATRALEPVAAASPPAALSVALAPFPIVAVAHRAVRQTVAYFSAEPPAHGSLGPSDFTARVAWGDGSSSRATVSAGAGVSGTFLGPHQRQILQFEVDGSHTYAAASGGTATVTLATASGAILATAKAALTVEPLDPAARWYSDPATPTAGDIALVVPQQPGPLQRPAASFAWHFGDGTAPVIDSAATRHGYMTLLAALRRDPGSAPLRRRAAALGIIPPLSSSFSAGLSDSTVTQIVSVWQTYFPAHVVPHVYPRAGAPPVALTITDSAGVSGEQTRAVPVSPHCLTWGGGYIPALSGYTTCDTLRGLHAVTGGPQRQPDYSAFTIAGSAAVLGGGATITITRDGSVFVSLSGGAGIGGGLVVSLAAGYVGPPFGRPPSNNAVDSFVDGWTIPVQGFASIGGRGSGVALIYSPSVVGGGEEYAVYLGEGAGVSIQASCAVDLGRIAALAPGSHISHASAISTIRTDARAILDRAGSLIGQSAVCADGAADPVSILFGGP